MRRSCLPTAASRRRRQPDHPGPSFFWWFEAGMPAVHEVDRDGRGLARATLLSPRLGLGRCRALDGGRRRDRERGGAFGLRRCSRSPRRRARTRTCTRRRRIRSSSWPLEADVVRSDTPRHGTVVPRRRLPRQGVRTTMDAARRLRRSSSRVRTMRGGRLRRCWPGPSARCHLAPSTRRAASGPGARRSSHAKSC